MRDFMQSRIAERIGGEQFGKSTVLYKFEKIKRAKAAARKAHPETALIDLGVGEPDEMAPAGIVEELYAQAQKPGNRGYSDNGIEEFKHAAASYMAEIYGVPGLNPETEINHAIGSKPALAMLPAVFINPGDVTLMTVPGYPVLGTVTQWLGGEVFPLPLREGNGYLPDLATVPPDVLRRTKLLYLNYPNNPTGAVASRDFFGGIVDWAHRHRVVVVHDAAYAPLIFDGEKPLSFLSTPGAKEIGIELHSLSKAYNMTGWRLAFVAGNPLAVKAFAAVKDVNDSGQFRAIQWAGIHALQHPEYTAAINAKYSRRHDMLAAALRQAGFAAKKPRGSFYLYVKAPKAARDGRVFKNAEDFSEYLITSRLISTVPWDDVEPGVRFSVTFEASGEAAEREVIDEVGRRLGGLGLEF